MRVAMGLMIAGLAGSCVAQQGTTYETRAEQDKHVRVNEIQVIGSHNSYHAGFAPSERKWMEAHSPKALHSLDYRHAPLADQLSGGVRQLEIDVFADAKGGRFAHPMITRGVAQDGLPADPELDPNHEMDKPGFKVMHVQDLDERSVCHTFVICLTQVKAWSKAHPGHLPLFLLIETKEGPLKDMPNAVKTEPFTKEVFDALDAEILSVFSKDEIVTPDEVRGSAATLNEAVTKHGWPTLAKTRGRVIFLMDQRPVEGIYTDGHPSLKGRILFTNAVPGLPDAAFTEENNGSLERIDGLVKQGYLVRTRTDESTEAARTNDTARRDLALKSGAQMVSTDYPPSEPSQWTPYVVKLPGGLVGRCNPVNAPKGCDDRLLETGTINR
jgi:hypothetical protein